MRRKAVKSWKFKNTKEDIERVAKEIRKDLNLGECDCMVNYVEIKCKVCGHPRLVADPPFLRCQMCKTKFTLEVSGNSD